MGYNELFLLIITVMATYMKPSEKSCAWLFVVMAYVTYFISTGAKVPSVYFYSMLSDVILCILLVTLIWSHKSLLAGFLIVVSVFFILSDFTGWMMYMKEGENDASVLSYNYNVKAYYAIIILLFMARLNYRGDSIRHTRFLRGNFYSFKVLGKVHK